VLGEKRRHWGLLLVHVSLPVAATTSSTAAVSDKRLTIRMKYRIVAPLSAPSSVARYKLVNDGHDLRRLQDYLVHKNISNTVRYTELDANRFKDFWR
jgi:hypothetical protein